MATDEEFYAALPSIPKSPEAAQEENDRVMSERWEEIKKGADEHAGGEPPEIIMRATQAGFERGFKEGCLHESKRWLAVFKDLKKHVTEKHD